MVKQLLIAACLLLLPFTAQPEDIRLPRPVVVELFTSQGCKSCPPADKILAELADDPNLLALSFHVDYWNRGGWTDPFSNEINTDRQKNYTSETGIFASIYTPQIIVDGAFKVIGTRRDQITAHIEDAREEMPHVSITLTPERDAVRVELGEAPQAFKDVTADIWVIGFDKEHKTEVRDGENKGETIINRNVVRSIEHYGDWYARPQSFEMKPWDDAPDYVAVLVQEKGQKRILGAKYIAYPELYR